MNYAQFRRPSRYIGSEFNITRKEAHVKVALCFPDTYEIGMSFLGFRILYAIINNISCASAERVFSPWPDLESHLKNSNLPLTSLEFHRPLRDFDVLGFTLQYELSYTNILNMLDLGGIPIRSEDREESHPLVIAGGPCAVNPLPLVPFVDAFVIGDGEEIIKEILEVYSGARGEGSGVRNTKDILIALSKIEGVFVPSIHDTDSARIKRRIIQDLDAALFPDAPIVPFTSIVHDRAAIEIARGCSRGCRFCQAGMIYRPVRERSPEHVLSLAHKSILNSGYEEVSFTSLSTGDYHCLPSLIKSFNTLCEGSRTSISLPSLRVGSINRDVLKGIKSIRKTGFTIAPEAGTRRLRNVINKDFSDEDYHETLNTLFSEGWEHIKLYFMIGLPTETQSDIDGLIDMAVTALKKGRDITRRRVNVNVGVSYFVPKPHTPFQWLGQKQLTDLRKKQDYIRSAFKKRGIKFKGQHVELSLLEAVFARADESSARLLEQAWKLGCRFDGWSEHFNFEAWLAAAEKTGINLHEYASRPFDLEGDLPWDFIDTGITKDFLRREYHKALRQEITADCRRVCAACGLECKEAGVRGQGSGARDQGSGKSHPSPITRHPSPSKLRVTFSKTGDMRYLSHQELMTVMLRAIRRARMPVAYSSGYHPHPRISFGPALPVGIQGTNEVFDIELTELPDAAAFPGALNTQLPEGINIIHAESIPFNGRSLSSAISGYEYEIHINPGEERKITSFLDAEKHEVDRDGKTVDIRPMVIKAVISEGTLLLTLSDSDKAKVRLHEVIRELLKKSDDETQSMRVKRIALYGYNREDKF